MNNKIWYVHRMIFVSLCIVIWCSVYYIANATAGNNTTSKTQSAISSNSKNNIIGENKVKFIETNDSSNVKQVTNIQTRISVISAFTALMAVIIGPIITLYIAKKQMALPIIKSRNDALLESTSSIISELNGFISKQRKSLFSECEKENKYINIKQTYCKIQLLLRNERPHHVNLINIYESVFQIIESESISIDDKATKVSMLTVDIINNTRDLMHQEMKKAI